MEAGLHKSPPVSQAIGYGIIVGVGMAFAVGMVGVTFALRRYQKEKVDAAEFTTAGRTVGPALTSCAVVSSWTWSATILVSSAQCYTNGIFGGYTYAAGGAVQVVLFATLAIELKRKAPTVYTYLEVVRERFGRYTHGIFMFYAWATNILVTAMLVAGASATTESLTGMHPVAACILIPLGTTIYTVAGGLRATFLTDYAHTVILYVIIFLFAFTVYANNSYLGSPGRVYDLLVEAGKNYPHEGNQDGSYLTMRSREAGLFLVINLCSSFGTVFLDVGYWNKAIASAPRATMPGYFLGGLMWFAIPFTCSMAMGLAGRVLEHTPYWPTYPRAMTSDEVSAGLVLPYAAVALLGVGGGSAALLLAFMAATSAMSAEMVSAASVWTFDVYRSYINPKASSKQLIMQTHLSVVAFVVVMIGFSIGLHYGGVGMGYLYFLLGVIICSAVIPVVLTLFWSGLNVWSATIAPPLGMALGITAWAATTAGLYDSEFTLDTTGSDYPMLAGNLVSLLSPVIIIPVCQLIGGSANFDFEVLKSMEQLRELPPEMNGEELEKIAADHKGIGEHNLTVTMSTAQARAYEKNEEKYQEDMKVLNRSAKWAWPIATFVTVSLLVVWPMPMYGTGYIFSKQFFTGWVCVGLIWLFISLIIIELWPLWQGRKAIAHTVRGIYWDLTGKSYKLREWQEEHPEELHVAFSPVASPVSFIAGHEVPLEGPSFKKDESS